MEIPNCVKFFCSRVLASLDSSTDDDFDDEPHVKRELLFKGKEGIIHSEL